MNRSILAALAAASLVCPGPAEAFNLSFVQGLLDDIGVNVTLPQVNVDLPAPAELAVESALDRAESALEGVFGDGGVLDGLNVSVPQVTIPPINLPDITLPPIPPIDVPQVVVPDVDQIVQDALDTARNAQANALARAQAEVDSALNRAQGILDGINVPAITIPQINLPQVNIPAITIPPVTVPDVNQIVQDGLNIGQSAVDDAIDLANDVLDDIGGIQIDLPDVDQIVEDALNDAQNAVDNALDDASGVIEEVLGDGGLVDDILGDLSVNLPPVAINAIENVFGSVSIFSLPATSAPAIPEPASLGLVALGLAAAGWRRR